LSVGAAMGAVAVRAAMGAQGRLVVWL